MVPEDTTGVISYAKSSTSPIVPIVLANPNTTELIPEFLETCNHCCHQSPDIYRTLLIFFVQKLSNVDIIPDHNTPVITLDIG